MKMRITHWVLCSVFLLVTAISTTHISVVRADEKPDAAQADEAGDKEDAAQDEEYYRLLKLFADTLDQVDRNYVKDVSRRELMEAAIRGMLTKLDQYSNYIPPQDIRQFKSSVESEFGGIGIQVSAEDGILKVISPIVGSPAYRGGVMAGDIISQIEGKPTKGITIDEAIKKLKGKVGTTVKITVKHPGDLGTEQVALKREIVRVDTVLGDTRDDKDKWNFMLDDKEKIAYIRITSFSRRTTEELKAALETLTEKELKGLVIDLRFNPGGLLSSAIEISDMFVSEGRIVSTKGRAVPERVWDAHKKDTYEDFPIAILVNHYSASASEIVSACLQDHERAVIIGERTWGKGSVQNIIQLEDGASALKLTTAGYRRPSGKNIHRSKDAKDSDDWGVTPNEGYEVKLKTAQIAAIVKARRDRDIVRKGPPGPRDFEDPQLDKALEYLRAEMSKGDVAKAPGGTKAKGTAKTGAES